MSNPNPRMLGAVCVIAMGAGLFFTLSGSDGSATIRTAEASLLPVPPPELEQPADVRLPGSPSAPAPDLGTFATIELQSRQIAQMHANNATAGQVMADTQRWAESRRIYTQSSTRTTGLCYAADREPGLKFYEC